MAFTWVYLEIPTGFPESKHIISDLSIVPWFHISLRIYCALDIRFDDLTCIFPQEFQDLQSSNTELRHEIRQLEREKQNLAGLLDRHMKSCSRKNSMIATGSCPGTESTDDVPSDASKKSGQLSVSLPGLDGSTSNDLFPCQSSDGVPERPNTKELTADEPMKYYQQRSSVGEDANAIQKPDRHHSSAIILEQRIGRQKASLPVVPMKIASQYSDPAVNIYFAGMNFPRTLTHTTSAGPTYFQRTLTDSSTSDDPTYHEYLSTI